MQLKAIDEGRRQGHLLNGKNSSNNQVYTENGDEEDDDESDDIKSRSMLHLKSNNHDVNNIDDDPDRLSDSDSDVVEMRQTIKELRNTQLECMSHLASSSIKDLNSKKGSKGSVNDGKTPVTDAVSLIVRNLRTTEPSRSRVYESSESLFPQPLVDLNGTSNKMMSTFIDNMNSSLRYNSSSRYQPNLSQTSQWSSQPTLVTREAVIKAARGVFAPNIIDQIAANNRSSRY